jgi:hypothetical protein
MIVSKMDLLTRCHGGGGGPGHAPKITPPAPTTAAENLAKNKILDRQRNARGYSSTLIGSLGQQDQGGTFLKKLLGE